MAGKTVLVKGTAGAVGACALQLALHAGALVIATCSSSADVDVALRAGAHAGVLLDDGYVDRVRALVPDGVDHIVEVAFAENATANTAMLAQGGAIASYASGVPQAIVDFWPLLFINARLFFVGSDDVPPDAKTRRMRRDEWLVRRRLRRSRNCR